MYECLDNSVEQQQLKDLMVSWGSGQLFQHFKNCSLDVNSLPLLTDRDLERLFPVEQMGHLLVFRQKLKEWKSLNIRDYETPIAGPSQVLYQNNQIHERTDLSTKEFDLTYYLANNGRMIKDEYIKNNNVLLDCLRDKLVTDCVEFYLNKKLFMKKFHFEKIAADICKIFTSERKETYYLNSDSCTYPTGRLYSTYRNSASNLRKNGLFPREKKTKRCKLSSTLLPDEDSSEIEDNDDLVWLQVYSNPFDIVLEKWCKTIETRIPHKSNKTLKQILNVWPKYSHSNGAQLIDIDFNYLHPGKGSILYGKWEQFVLDVVPIIKSSAKDKNTIDQFKHFDVSNPNFDKDSRDLLILRSLHAVLPPTGHAKHNQTKKVWKFSILDSQNAFIRTAHSFTSLEETRKMKQVDYFNYGLNYQPNILIITENNNTCYYAAYDTVIYKFDHLLQALNTCFKIHYVFNLKYQSEAKTVWEFIQSYFFEIDGNFSSTALSTVLGKLQNAQK